MTDRALDLTSAPNLNALWSRLILEELARHGVREIAVCPGSRSTPLAIEAAHHPKLEATVVTDERAAGYFAVGSARANGVPAAVITTSGTAVSNLLPAVTEADLDGVPLVLLTADRPPELRDAAANQTIAQPGIFGERVRWSIDLACPSGSISPAYVLTSIDAALRSAATGPVHVNLPFREPLAPTPEAWDASILRHIARWESRDRPFTTHVPPRHCPDDASIDAWMSEQPMRGLIVVAGRGIAGDIERRREVVERLATVTGWPVIADVRSGLRLGYPSPAHASAAVGRLGHRGFEPDALLQLGHSITSKRLATFLAARPHVAVTVVAPTASRIDPDHRAHTHIEADPDLFADAVAARWSRTSSAARPNASKCARDLDAIEDRVRKEGRIDEPTVARVLSKAVSADHGLFVGSSLPVRLVDAYAAVDGAAVPVAGNRGASGIDGSIASAIGFARGLRRPVTALLGDLTVLHDLSSLPLLATATPGVTLVILNNGGGGIFRLLPIATHDDVFEPFFATRHPHRFGPIMGAFGIPHRDVSTLADFETANRELAGRTAVIEVRVDPDDTVAAIRAYDDAVGARDR